MDRVISVIGRRLSRCWIITFDDKIRQRVLYKSSVHTIVARIPLNKIVAPYFDNS